MYRETAAVVPVNTEVKGNFFGVADNDTGV
jgi:hypothetical protein